MRTPFKFNITLNQEQLAHFQGLLGTESVPTQNDMALFFAKCVRSALSFEVDEPIEDIGDAVIEDINRGGWSMVGQPPSSHEITRQQP